MNSCNLQVASIIYLDAPAGVGFSVDLNTTAHVFTDDEVAHDNLLAVTEWFKKFPERQRNDFYVAGESYGGTYVPMLSALLLKGFPQFKVPIPSAFSNLQCSKHILVKGMLIGNGCVDERLLYNSLVGYNYDHTFIDESQYRSIIDKCCPNNSSYGCDFYKMSLDRNNKCYNDSLTLNQANVFHYVSLGSIHSSSTTLAVSTSQIQLLINTRRRQLHALIIMTRRFIYKERTCAVLSIFPALSLCMKAANIENTYDLTVTHYITQHDNVKKVIDAKKKVALFYGDVDSMCNAIHGAQFASGMGMNELYFHAEFTLFLFQLGDLWCRKA
ncbi:serine carboxypeptidase [Cooperia oncophora]